MRRLLTAILLLSLGSSAWGEMYTWKDRQGTAHYTNSIHEIPARYLRKARVLDVATGRMGALVTQQPAMPATTAAGPGQPQFPPVSANAAAVAPEPPSQPSAGAAPAPSPAQPATLPQVTSPAPAALTAPQSQPRSMLTPRRRHRHGNGDQEDLQR